MKNLFTLLILSAMTFSSYAQEATIYVGIQGKDLYYRTDTGKTADGNDASVYLASLELTFENESIYSEIATDNVMSWINVYGALQLNAGAANWTVTKNEDNKVKLLIYTNANGVLKPTNGEFVKFLALSSANAIVSIDDAAVFVSEDTTLASDELITPTAIVDNALKIDDVTISKITPYPNPITGNELNIGGIKETMQATIYDIMGRVATKSTISPENNKLDVSKLSNSLYILSLDNGIQTHGFTIVKQ
jgi:hypothetical protein